MQRACGLVFDNFFQKHITGSGHPENYMRASHVYQGLRKANLLEEKLVFRPKPINEELLTLAHEENYLKQSKKDIVNGESSLSTGDTAICPDSWEVACLAAGAAMQAVDLLFSDKINRCFCPTRPPGHHANSFRGMGFCIFNHVALAARYAQKKYKVGKILIVDWDVHHGNGTQDIFYEDDSIFFCSTHQAPWYPGTGSKDETGKGRGLGTNLNFPFPAGSGNKEIVDYAIGQELLKKMNSFKPELILISAGFDSREGDPLGQFKLQDHDFAKMTEILGKLSEEFCNGKIISILEGGYNFDGLLKASIAHFEALSSK